MSELGSGSRHRGSGRHRKHGLIAVALLAILQVLVVAPASGESLADRFRKASEPSGTKSPTNAQPNSLTSKPNSPTSGTNTLAKGRDPGRLANMFAVYPLADAALTGEKAVLLPVTRIARSTQPLFTLADITHYDLSTHRVTLPLSFLRKQVKALRLNRHRGAYLPVVVAVRGQQRYLAGIDAAELELTAAAGQARSAGAKRSTAPPEAMVELTLHRPWRPQKHQLVIAHQRTDLRDDKLIRKTLQQGGVLRSYRIRLTRDQAIEASRGAMMPSRWPPRNAWSPSYRVPTGWKPIAVHFVSAASVSLRNLNIDPEELVKRDPRDTITGPFPVHDAWLIRWAKAKAPPRSTQKTTNGPITLASDREEKPGKENAPNASPPSSSTPAPSVWIAVFDRTGKAIVCERVGQMHCRTYQGMDPYTDMLALQPLANRKAVMRHAGTLLKNIDPEQGVTFYRSVDASVPNPGIGADHLWVGYQNVWVVKGQARDHEPDARKTLGKGASRDPASAPVLSYVIIPDLPDGRGRLPAPLPADALRHAKRPREIARPSPALRELRPRD